MRWTLRIIGILALAWLVFLASPFVALHNFAREIEARDVAAVRHRVSLRALRISLLKQVLIGYAREKGRNVDEGQRQLAVEAGLAVAGPVVEPLLTPEAIIDLLNDGWPQSVPAAGEPAAPAPGAPLAAQLRLRSFATAWQVFRGSEMRGFRNVIVALPPGQAADRQFRLRLRLVRATWKLVSIELPPTVVAALVRKLPASVR